MHHYLFENATEQQLKTALIDMFDTVKDLDHDLYERLEMTAYKSIFGCHFNEHTLDKALKNMINEDGTKGGHWTLEQTTSLAASNKIVFSNFNEYDFNYVMNMLYSDYYGHLSSNDTMSFLKLAKAFLNDKDAEEGKAFKYYIAMR